MMKVRPNQESLREYTHLSAVLLLNPIVILCVQLYDASPIEHRLHLSDITNTIDGRAAKRSRATITNTPESGCVLSPLQNSGVCS